MTDPEAGPERRGSRRMTVKRLAVLYHPPADPHDILHGRTSHKGVAMDLSQQGMRILVREPLSVGSQLSLTLEIPSLHREIVVKGEVTRCQEVTLKPKDPKPKDPPATTYELGVSLSQAGVAFRELLIHLRTHPLLRIDGI